MPELVLYSRRWHATTDTLPFPLSFGALFHAVFLIVYGALIGRFGVWSSCPGQGANYIAVTGGLMAIIFAELVLELAMIYCGLKGAPLQISKRRPVDRMMYALTICWLIQTALMVYGTVVLAVASPLCYDLARAGHMRNVTRTMVALIYAFTVGIAIAVAATYNSHGSKQRRINKEKKAAVWEERVACMSWCMGCSENMQREVGGSEGGGAALPSIAQWVSGLFENVDLSPSDISAALILSAASQQLRRKMRIKNALDPKLQAMSEVGSVTHTDDVSEATDSESDDVASVSDLTDEGPEEAATAPKTKDTVNESHGGQTGDLTKVDDPYADVALPKNYPKAWKDAAATAYAGVVEDTDNLSQGKAGLQNGSHEPARQHDGPDSAPAHANGDSPDHLPPSSHERASTSSQGSVVALGDLAPGQLRQQVPADYNVPAQRFGLPVEDGQDPTAPPPDMEADRHSAGAEAVAGDVPARQPPAKQASMGSDGAKSIGKDSLATDAVLPEPGQAPGQTGTFQASLTEPGGGLPAVSELSLDTDAKTNKSGGTGMLSGLLSVFSDSKDEPPEPDGGSPPGATPDPQSRAVSLAVPLERQLSNMFSTVLTPSGQVSDLAAVAGVELGAEEAVAEYLGDRSMVSYKELQTADNLARFACAVYAVAPVAENQDPPTRRPYHMCGMPCPCCRGPPPLTMDTVRQNCVTISGIKDQDLLYFSHSNVALSHLPYMVALDRPHRQVILAIRGTSSVADLVTDAVMHPEHVGEWLPSEFRSLPEKEKRKMFAHAGILLAAQAILDDLKATGLLERLKRTESERKQHDPTNVSTDTQGQVVGTIMQEYLDTKGWRLIVTGHSLGAGAAALLTLALKDRFPSLRCWAFSPPGGLVSRALLRVMDKWTNSVVVGKDAVPRASVNNLSRLMDEMVTALARCRHHKLKVLTGAWWNKDNRPPPEHLFYSYKRIPKECRRLLERYFKSREVKGNAMNMFPPGRIIFVRPLKQYDGEGKKVGQEWDTVWITPEEIIGEGILISPKMLQDHLIESTIMTAIAAAIARHPENPKGRQEKQENKQEVKDRASFAEDNIVPPTQRIQSDTSAV